MVEELIKSFLPKMVDNAYLKIETEVFQIVYNRILEYQVEEYTRNLFTKTILHRSEPVNLYDIYQPLYVQQFGKNNIFSERICTNSPRELFSISNFITLFGTAGSGKSTMVKYLLLKSIEEDFKIPVKVELRYLNTYNGNLFDYINNEIFKLNQLAFDEKIIRRLLSSGKYLIFFDGYDELSSKVKETITKDILSFTKVYNKNSYLVTSRPYTNIELLTKFHNYQVCQLDDSEIIQFVQKQFIEKENEIVDKIINAIEENKKSYNSYLRNPLLLSMFILTFQTYSNVPPKKCSFYKQVFDSLLYLHDSMSKLAYTRELKSGLNKEQIENVLRLFSMISFFKQIFSFSESFILSTFNEIKEKKENLVFDNFELIEDLQISICILQKEGAEYLFPHRSLQEYFATQYIVNLSEDNKNRIYSKLANSFISYNINDLISQDNFFVLLREQDYEGVTERITIPALESILLNIKRGEIKRQQIQLVLFILMLLMNFLISYNGDQDIEQVVLTKTLFKEHSKKKIDLAEDKKNEVNSDNNMKKINDVEDNLLSQLKKIIPEIVVHLKSKLDENRKSDSMIIDLI